MSIQSILNLLHIRSSEILKKNRVGALDDWSALIVLSSYDSDERHAGWGNAYGKQV